MSNTVHHVSVEPRQRPYEEVGDPNPQYPDSDLALDCTKPEPFGADNFINNVLENMHDADGPTQSSLRDRISDWLNGVLGNFTHSSSGTTAQDAINGVVDTTPQPTLRERINDWLDGVIGRNPHSHSGRPK